MKFSVIIPTFNRSESLFKTLSALAKTDRTRNQIEVIVVDNSTSNIEMDATRKKVKSAKTWFKIRYLRSKLGGPSPSRNLGIRNSKYSHLIFIDDDTTVSSNFIKGYVRAWSTNRRANMIGGKVVPRLTFAKPEFVKPGFEWIYADKDLGGKRLEVGYPEFLFSSNMSIRLQDKDKKSAIFNINLGRRYQLGYCIFGEDTELCFRYQLQGKKIIYEPGIRVVNHIASDRLNSGYYWRRIINAGIERRLINFELARVYQQYTSSDEKPGIINNFKESMAFLFGYYLVGSLLILYLKLKRSS